MVITTSHRARKSTAVLSPRSDDILTLHDAVDGQLEPSTWCSSIPRQEEWSQIKSNQITTSYRVDGARQQAGGRRKRGNQQYWVSLLLPPSFIYSCRLKYSKEIRNVAMLNKALVNNLSGLSAKMNLLCNSSAAARCCWFEMCTYVPTPRRRGVRAQPRNF